MNVTTINAINAKNVIKEKKMKIAIPAYENQTLCPHFGHAPNFAIIEVNDETKQVNSIELLVPEMGGHEAVPPWLKSLGVSVLVAGGIGQRAIDNLQAHQITVLYGAQEKPVKEITEEFLNNKLTMEPRPCNHIHHDNCEHHDHEHQHQHENEREHECKHDQHHHQHGHKHE
jgi:predicted Fe-Mo cluster-binding NifX family protein